MGVLRMADPILHIKDGYFFQVPKRLWRYDYQKLSDVPGFLTKEHPEVKDVKLFNEAMDGKILIPQPFGQIKNLYEAKPGEFCISRFMILELVVALIAVVVFARLASKARNGDRP